MTTAAQPGPQKGETMARKDEQRGRLWAAQDHERGNGHSKRWGNVAQDRAYAEEWRRLTGAHPWAVALPAFGCFVWIDTWQGRTVLRCESMMADGSWPAFDPDNFATDVTAPESQEFLDACNAAFGISFQLDQFSGR